MAYISTTQRRAVPLGLVIIGPIGQAYIADN